MKNHKIVLGVDGGGSKTVAVVARQADSGSTEILGRGVAGAANPNVVGIEGTISALDQAIAGAVDDAGGKHGGLACACVALAGGADGAVQKQLLVWALRGGLAARFIAVHDALPVLAAGTPDGWGVAVISGTGSLVFGRDCRGREARAGGWGHVFGDEGSGYAVAVAGLQAVAQELDATGPTTLLTKGMLGRFAVNQPRDIVDVVNRPPWDRAAVATLAKVVCRAADAGDVVAGQILDRAARALADGVAAVANRLKLLEKPVPFALAGGLLARDRGMRDRLTNCLEKAGFESTQVGLVEQPVLGAVRLAIENLKERNGTGQD